MTFIELVEHVSKLSGQSKVLTKSILKSTFSAIESEVLANKRDVAVPGFGKFKLRSVKGGWRTIGGVERDIKARDTLKFVSYAKRAR